MHSHSPYSQYAVPPATAIAVTAPNVAALCCSSAQPHLPVITRWEAQIDAFLAWLAHNGRNGAPSPPAGFVEYLVRLQTTISYGRACGEQFFAASRVNPEHAQHYTLRCAYKNYTCPKHNLYFQLDVKQRPTHA
ncbi:hypothetical protein BKA62DRAFT_703499 [Auriculariales sp. MPI-PUGE-AT-0066]|nr:hypothetical protein BKA62DRAFT_703499 [Auriculariales sp. MPI-PUGE-AT-0066]